MKDTIEQAQETERAKGEALRDLLASLPNLPFEDVPPGRRRTRQPAGAYLGVRPTSSSFRPRTTPISARLCQVLLAA
ncbi:MAG: hypothetical protein WDN06_01650 [Asticcacaulis sp.]